MTVGQQLNISNKKTYIYLLDNNDSFFPQNFFYPNIFCVYIYNMVTSLNRIYQIKNRKN